LSHDAVRDFEPAERGSKRLTQQRRKVFTQLGECDCHLTRYERSAPGVVGLKHLDLQDREITVEQQHVERYVIDDTEVRNAVSFGTLPVTENRLERTIQRCGPLAFGDERFDESSSGLAAVRPRVLSV
jgi:hypothetical protein